MRIIGEQRQGDVNLTSKGTGEVTIEESYVYIVEADTKTDNRLYVSQCPGLPVVGVTRSAGGLAVCKSIQGQRRQENPLIWDFTCSFSSEVEENNDQQPGTDPEVWVPVRKTIFEKLEYRSLKDVNGKPYVTSAGEEFKGRFPRTLWLLSWEFSQFESISVTDEDLMDRNEVVNGATYKGKQAKTLLCRIMESSVGFFYGQRRRLTKYRITWKKDKWTEEVIDGGTFYLDSTGKKIPFITLPGNPVEGLLDGNGGAIALAKPPGNPVYLEFDSYETSSFSFLRI